MTYKMNGRLPIDTPAAHDSVLKGDPPSVALVKIASTIKHLQETGVYTATTDDPPKSFCGRVANCVIWETSHWKLVTSVVQVGDFIRLRNIRDKQDSESRLRCKSQNGWSEYKLTPSSKLNLSQA